MGSLLLAQGLITESQLDHALQEQRSGTKMIGDVLLELGYVSHNELDLQYRDLMMKSLLGVLQPVFDLELVVSDFYYMCAEQFPEMADFWKYLGNDGIRHCLYIGQIIEALYKRPHLFSRCSPFTPQVVTDLTASVQHAHRRVKSEQLSLKEALRFAYAFEIGMLENRLFDLLSTRDEEVQKLIERIRSEAQLHRQKIIDNASGAEAL